MVCTYVCNPRCTYRKYGSTPFLLYQLTYSISYRGFSYLRRERSVKCWHRAGTSWPISGLISQSSFPFNELGPTVLDNMWLEYGLLGTDSFLHTIVCKADDNSLYYKLVGLLFRTHWILKVKAELILNHYSHIESTMFGEKAQDLCL